MKIPQQFRAPTPDDVAASFYRLMGIDHHTEHHTPDGRPVLLVREGKPIQELFSPTTPA